MCWEGAGWVQSGSGEADEAGGAGAGWCWCWVDLLVWRCGVGEEAAVLPGAGAGRKLYSADVVTWILLELSGSCLMVGW